MKKKIAPTQNQTHRPGPFTNIDTNVTTTPPLKLVFTIALNIYEHHISMIKDLSSGLHMQGPLH